MTNPCSPYREGFRAALQAVVAIFVCACGAAAAPTPEAAVRAFAQAILARDYAAAYELISPGDRAHKSREEYLQENEAFSGFALRLAQEFARLIRDDQYQVEYRGDRATVLAKWRLPDGNAPVVTRLAGGWDPDKLNALSPAEQAQVLGTLVDLARDGKIPALEAEDRFEVVREGGDWYIRMVWAQIDVRGAPRETTNPLDWNFSVTVRDLEGKAVEGAEVILTAHMPIHPWLHTLSPTVLKATASPGVYAGTLTFEMQGEWAVEVAVSGPATGIKTVRLKVPAGPDGSGGHIGKRP